MHNITSFMNCLGTKKDDKNFQFPHWIRNNEENFQLKVQVSNNHISNKSRVFDKSGSDLCWQLFCFISCIRIQKATNLSYFYSFWFHLQKKSGSTFKDDLRINIYRNELSLSCKSTRLILYDLQKYYFVGKS